MIKLGFVSAILPELTLKEVIDFASANGYSCVELMCWPFGKAERRYAGVTHLDVAALDENEIVLFYLPYKKGISSTIIKEKI